MPTWVEKLVKRLMGLPRGRYMVVLTVGDDTNWTVTDMGKVER